MLHTRFLIRPDCNLHWPTSRLLRDNATILPGLLRHSMSATETVGPYVIEYPPSSQDVLLAVRLRGEGALQLRQLQGTATAQRYYSDVPQLKIVDEKHEQTARWLQETYLGFECLRRILLEVLVQQLLVTCMAKVLYLQAPSLFSDRSDGGIGIN